MTARPPRPPPTTGRTGQDDRASAPSPEGSLRLPIGDHARLLVALCRRGEAHRPYEESEGWAWYRWEDPDGREGRVGLRSAAHPEHTDADDLAARALVEAPLRERSLVELAALLTRLVELDGVEGVWRLERVAELLYGPARPSSHRERQLPALHAWLALLERGQWCLAGASGNRAQRRSRKSRPQTSASDGPLLRIERATRVSATVRLEPDLAQSLRAAVVTVPPETFRLPQHGHANPHGNRPGLATRARTRVAAAFAAYRRGGPAVDLECLLVRHAGIDLAPVTRRRRLATWFDDLSADLIAIGARLGVGLASAPARARRVLSTVLCLVTPQGGVPPRPVSPAVQHLAPRPPPT